MGITRKQSAPNFPKNEHFFPCDTHAYIFVFQKTWRALFSCNIRFEIRSFALFPKDL